MKKGKKIALIVAAAVVSLSLIVGFLLTRGLDHVQNETIAAIDFSTLPDGVYVGGYEYGRWKNDVEVKVEHSRVTSITPNGPSDITGAPEQIYERVVQSQSLQVDMVSGSTVSSKAALKAVENALEENR